MSEPVVFAQGLRKEYRIVEKGAGVGGAFKALFKPTYRVKEAVKGVDLSLEAGEIVGFLGPNGAGKTTTLKMLAGILPPSAGECRVLGHVPFDRKTHMLRRIALVMGNKNQLWWDLPAWDGFVVLKELYDVSEHDFKRRTDRLIEMLDLGDKIHTQIRKLSLGERMKCELVAALLHRPKVVFLDEPSIGLDVVSARRIREFLRESQAEDESTILLTSHYMQDVTELCKRVVVIAEGSLIFEGTLPDLTERYASTRRIRLGFSKTVERADVEGVGEVTDFDGLSAVVEVPSAETPTAAATLLSRLPVSSVAIEEPEMEDIVRRLFEASK